MKINRLASLPVVSFALLGFLGTALPVAAADLTWTGADLNNDWNDPANWSPPQVPTADDHVFLNSGNVTVPASAAFAAFDWTGGTISGSLTVASNAVLNWNGGSMGGPLTVSSSGVLNLNGGVALYGALTNGGTVNWLGGSVAVYNSGYYGGAGVIENLTGAVWNIQCDQSIFDPYSYQANAYFRNAGTVQKTAGTGTTSLNIPVENLGVVTVLQGTLGFNGGGYIDGVYNAAAGTVINFYGSYTSGTAVLNGPGVFQFTGGTLTLVSEVIPNLQMIGGTLVLGPNFQGGTITNLTLNAMTLSGNYTVSGTFNWFGGSVNGPLTVSSSGVLNLNGGVALYGALTNGGTVNWLGGSVAVYNSGYYGGAGVIENLTGAVWNIQCDQSIFDPYSYQANAYFRNAGTVQKTAGTGTTSLNIPVENLGVVTVLQGTLGFNGGGYIDGVYNAAAGTVINFYGSYTSGTAVLNGPGVFQFTGGTLTLVSEVIPNLQMIGGTLVLGPNFQGGTITNLTLNAMTLSGNYTVSGTFNWFGGSVNGPLTVSSSGVLNLNGGVALYGALTNGGTVNWLGGSVAVYNSGYYGGAGVIENLTGAVWNIQCDQSIFDPYSYQANAYFRNAGTVQKTAGTGTTSLNIPVENLGVVTVLQGTLGFNGGGYIDGVYNAAAGTVINFYGSYTSGTAVLNGPGVFQFTGGTLTLVSEVIPNLQMVGGTLVLGPAFQGGTITNLTLNAMTLSGNYTVSGTFNWFGGSVNGPLTVSSSGVLNLNGGVALYGALTNGGTVNWLGGSVAVYNSGYYGGAGVIENLTGAVWNIQCDQSIFDPYSYQANAYFRNAGTVQKTAGTGTTSLNIPVENLGVVTVLQGTLGFNGGGYIDGVYNAAAGTVINFYGSYTSGTAVLNGPGVFQFTGGTLTLVSEVIPNLQMIGGTLVLGPAFQGGTITNLTLNAMTLSGNYTVSGTFNWFGGSVNGPLTVSSSGVLNLNGGVALYGALTNGGTVNWLGGSVAVYNSGYYGGAGVIENLTGAVWNIQCDQSIFDPYSYQANAYFRNAGTVQKTAGTGTTSLNIPVENLGVVTVLQGTLGFNGGGYIDGVYNAAAGTVINFYGSYTSGTAVLNGPGVFQFTGGTLTLVSEVIPNLQMIGGTLVLGPNFQGGTITNLTLNAMTLSGNYTVSGTFNWFGGSVNGPLTVSSSGVLNLNGGVALYGALTNGGTVNWLGGSVAVYNSGYYGGAGVIENLTGAVWNIQCDQSIFDPYSYQANAYFRNAGTVQKTAGTGTTSLNIPVENLGTVKANRGNLAFNSTFVPDAGKLQFGLRSPSDFGTISIAGNAALGGTVGVAWLDGFVPATGDSWTVLNYGSYSGLFTNVDLPPAALWATNYFPTYFTVEVARIDKLTFTTQPVGGKIPGAILAPVVVQVQHPIGDPVFTNGVPVTLGLGSGTGVLSGTLTRNTDATGKATFDDLSFDSIGVRKLRATAPNLTPATSIAFAIAPLIEVRWTPDGLVLRLNGPNAQGPLVIYASTDLETWTPIHTNPPSATVIEYLDPDSTSMPVRFYRVIEQ